jgi:hypothetical protein
VFIFGYEIGFHFGPSVNGVTSRFLISNAGLDFTTEGIRVTGGGTTGQVSNVYQVGGHPNSIGLHVTADDVRIQATNLRLSEVGRNGVRVEGAKCRIMLENLWVDGWNQSAGGFPAIEVGPGNTAYVGRGRMLDRGGDAPETGGGGTILLDG